MVGTDPIADMLSRIRNAALAGKTEVSIPFSKLKENVAKIILEAGYASKIEVEGEGILKNIKLSLTDSDQSNVKFSEIKRISKPGRRVYAKADEIPKIMNGRGIVVISTSNGIMTDRQARKNRIGGELICSIY